MKYCVSDKVGIPILKKADEIKFKFKDRRAIPDFFEKYPQADIILQISPYDDIDWDELKLYNGLSKGKFILCLGTLESIHLAKGKGFRCYYGYPITTSSEVAPLINMGVEYIKVNAPLFFNMKALEGKPVRITANIPYTDGLPREDGVNGVWLRPEDQEMYEPYIKAIEFEDVEVDKEELLYRIYAEDKEWNHGLNLIINNLNYRGSNRLLSSEMTKHRMFCKQACADDPNACHLCWRMLDLADAERVQQYKDLVYGSIHAE